MIENGVIAEDGDPKELKKLALGKFAGMLNASTHTIT